jgi:hypothetical protein
MIDIALTSLWLPILLSAVLVFAASSIVHMVLTYHRTDYGKLPAEDAVLDALRQAKVAPGSYLFPHASSPKEMGSPEMMAKYQRGPIGMLLVRPSGPPAMAKHLMWWFVFCLVVGIFAAYVASRTLPAGTDYLTVFRITGTVAFLGYASGDVIASIWRWQSWPTTLKGVLDGLLYALLTAGAFGWLWPAA